MLESMERMDTGRERRPSPFITTDPGRLIDDEARRLADTPAPVLLSASDSLLAARTASPSQPEDSARVTRERVVANNTAP